MDDLLILLKTMEPRPQLYIGSKDLFSLRHLLSGYCLAKEEDGRPCGKWLFDDFCRFLAQKYEDTRSFDWAHLIFAHEGPEPSTDDFFRLLHDYWTTLDRPMD